MIRARPIRFTADLAAHRRYLDALGATRVTTAPGWEVYAVGSGRLAIHAASDEQPSGRTMLGWEVDDFDAWVMQATSAGLQLEVGPNDNGIAATVTAPDGTTFTVDPSAEAEQPAPRDHALAVLPLWVTPETTSAREVLTGLGAQQRIAADDGVWTDFVCPGGGLAAVHATDGERDVELAFEFDGDIESLIPVLDAAGVDAMLIDESYSRTLQIADPDLPGARVLINEKQRDLHGYSASGAVS